MDEVIRPEASHLRFGLFYILFPVIFMRQDEIPESDLLI